MTALILFSPLLIPIILILRFSGEGEIFFMQDRIGKSGKVFQLYKFATMLRDSPNIGTGTVTMKNDPRVLPVGKFLRKSKINELPQLLNIIFGEMSIIGPRPLTEQAFDSYSESIQNIIKQVKPGLSGVGSIVFYNEEDLMQGASASTEFYRDIIAPYKGILEEWFVLNNCLYVYFVAIFLTVWVIFFSRTSLVWSFFKGLPEPPDELKRPLSYNT